MSVLSGKNAVMTGIGTLRNWSIDPSSVLHEPRGSNTAAYPYVVVGNSDWKGRASFYGYLPNVYPGATFTFAGKEETTSGDYWTGAAIMSLLRVRIPTNEAKPIEGYVEFEGNGALSTATGSVTDATSPTIYPSKSRGAKWDDVAIDDIEFMEFTLSCANQPYVTDATAGVTKRTAGNLSASGSFGVIQSQPSKVMLPGSQGVLKYYVSASTFYQFSFATLSGTNIAGDREGGTLGRKVYPWTFSGWKASDGSQGTIILPSATVIYP